MCPPAAPAHVAFVVPLHLNTLLLHLSLTISRLNRLFLYICKKLEKRWRMMRYAALMAEFFRPSNSMAQAATMAVANSTIDVALKSSREARGEIYWP
jgi:hypothetical protein